MTSRFNRQIRHVQPGSDVTAQNTSTPTRELEQRTNYLFDRLDVETNNGLVQFHDVPVDPTVIAGQAVFWDSENSRFSKALADATVDAATGTVVATASADCLGICLSKSSSTIGTIAAVGVVRLTAEQLTALIGDATAPGRYYLSATTAGQLVQQRPAVTVSVAYVIGPPTSCDTDSLVLIYPQLRDFAEDHIHYQIELAAVPAGDHVQPAEGASHVITSANTSLPGWLPADDPIFDGHAPTGAKFGYNMAAHPELSRAWPPIPVTAAVLEMHQPVLSAAEAKVEGLERVPSELVRMDNYGIWWMSDCYNQVPWDTTLDTSASSSSATSSAGTDCPSVSRVQLILSFLKMTFGTSRSVVTSLRAATNTPIAFTDLDGAAASVGDLVATLSIDTTVSESDDFGGVVLKTIGTDEFRFTRGWVAEGVVAGSENVILSSSRQRLLDPTQPLSGSNPTVHQGIVTVDVSLEPGDREISPQIIRLGDALEREYKGLTYLAFPAGKTSGLNMRFDIPATGIPTSPTLKIRAQMFGRANGPFSAMTVTRYRVVRPTSGTPTAITGTTTAVAFDVVTPTDNYDGLGGNLPYDHVIEVESAAFAVAAGDTVYITLNRAASATPTFNADIGVIRVTGIIGAA